MAIDDAILEHAARGDVLPTLRLYAWMPACLSLGYAQPAQDVDLPTLEARGWDLVRRPTGGRAILHTDELTYSVTGPQDEPRLVGNVLESYRILSQALLAALRLLGIPAEASEKAAGPQPDGPQNPVCFEVPSNYEILVGGKKLIGSAQSRRKQGVLQHGSLPLFGDLTRITQALAFPSSQDREKAALRLLERATTAGRILGHALDYEQASKAFCEGFRSALNIDFIPNELTTSELERAEALLAEKYANRGWTFRV